MSATVDGVDVYDYRKIGQQDRYKMNVTQGNVQVKASRFLGRTNTLSLLGGVEFLDREETYREKGFVVRNVLLTPQVGLEMKQVSQRLEARLTALYGHRTSVKDKYEVDVDLDRHTEYQHAFSTYAYFAHQGDVLNLEAEVAHSFRFARMGVRLQWMWMTGLRLDHAAYDSNRYAEQIPMAFKHTVSVTPDKHDRQWTKLTLFAEF